MRTYQRMVICKGGDNVAYPHNFLIYDPKTRIIKIGETGIRYNSLSPGQMTSEETLTDAPSSLSTIRSLGGVSSSPI